MKSAATQSPLDSSFLLLSGFSIAAQSGNCQRIAPDEVSATGRASEPRAAV